jgi:hypothetical protein
VLDAASASKISREACVVIALREVIKLICARNGFRERTLTAADVRVTQVVNGSKGNYVTSEKKLLKPIAMYT